MTPKISVAQSSVRKVCQLTGQTDLERNTAAFNTTGQRFSLYGTDLGSSFEHDGKLWFLFGDTWPTGQDINHPGSTDNSDSVAWTTDAQPEPGVNLTFVSQNQRYTSPRLVDQNGQNLSVGAFQVPIAGFSVNDQMYIFYTTGITTEGMYDGGLDAFWVTPDGSVGSSWASPGVNSGIWRPAFTVTPPQAARADSPVAVVTRFSDALDLFWIGPDGSVDTTWSNPAVDSGDWHTPFAIAPARSAGAHAAIAAVTRLAGALDVFWVGADNAVHTNWANPAVDNAHWHVPFAVSAANAVRANSPVAAITRLEGALDAFWIGPDGAIMTNWANPKVDNAKWHTAFPITPPGAASANSPLAAVTRLNGALDVFWIGPDNAIHTTWANPAVDNAKWHPPFAITPANAARTNSPLAAITRLEGALDVFWIGPDGAVATTWANPKIDNANWHAAFPISSPAAAGANSQLTAVTRFNGALDAFWIGADGAPATNWANPDVDNARWHTAFPITAPGASNAQSTIGAVTRRNGFPDPKIMASNNVLAIARANNPTDLHVLYDFSVLQNGGKFLNVACVIVPEGLPGVPFTGAALLAWGSGRYRESDVYFACSPLSAVTQASAWHYYTGVGPAWSSDQRAAAPLFDQPQVGELSVMRLEALGVWLMAYNATSPRGINARVASSPWGPWSDPTLLFDPGWPGVGYGHFMHVKNGPDHVCDPGRESEWGGEYGPYMINRYTRIIRPTAPGPLRAIIYFVMSTWNPYNTVLMTAELQREADTP